MKKERKIKKRKEKKRKEKKKKEKHYFEGRMTEKLRPHIGAMINQEEEAQKSLLHCEEKSILCKCQSELLQTPHKS